MADKSESSAPQLEVKKSKVRKVEALWLTSFADLSFILMCFFALLLSMSTINAKKKDHITQAFTQQDRVKIIKNLDEIEKQIKTQIKEKKLEHAVSAKLDTDGLAIEFKSNSLFSPGSDVLNPEFSTISHSIMMIIASSPPKYTLTIEGHTDDTPLGSKAKFASNWELSAARGISILKNLTNRNVNPNRMKVIAFADTKPKVPIYNLQGDDLSNARAANRRVVIRLD
ncbi:MAG: flagellar motor protein MotB [Oligoflexales bacterium]|nr:flagellar motor protein MotB [Oligoflexales bacterium]